MSKIVNCDKNLVCNSESLKLH